MQDFHKIHSEVSELREYRFGACMRKKRMVVSPQGACGTKCYISAGGYFAWLRSLTMKSILLAFLVALLTGCASAARLSPVQGPLATQSPPRTYKVSMEGDYMETKLGNGDTCRGEWLDVVPEDPAAREMAAAWDL